MPSLVKAFQAAREKPHSSITDWVEILTGQSIAEEAYDGIPELVDSINLQVTGPTEASRAIRKKLKHGNSHQQYRSLVILKALVENCGTKFLSAFSDGTLTDALKHTASDAHVDKRVRKKLALVLSSWEKQYADEPSMSLVAGLYKQCRFAEKSVVDRQREYSAQEKNYDEERRLQEEKRLKEKEEKKAAKAKAKAEEEERRRNKGKPKRVPFDFERDKPKVIESISEASLASSNLINAITLVNTDKESLQDNERVQECLAKAKQVRKSIVRYVQLVENEELIGTLIETNERIMQALETYDQSLIAAVSKLSAAESGTVDTLSSSLASTHLTGGEVSRLQEKQKAAIQRARGDIAFDFNQEYERDEYDSSPDPGQSKKGSSYVHPDLEDLRFGELGPGTSSKLPPPMRPKRASDDSDDDDEVFRRGSLSDYSDYESSDEETHKKALEKGKGKPYVKRDYVTVSSDSLGFSRQKLVEDEDPFADPFADSAAVKV